jgi:hypothetical protein
MVAHPALWITILVAYCAFVGAGAAACFCGVAAETTFPSSRSIA